MASKISRIKTESFAVPQTREEADRFLLRMGELQQEVLRIQADMNDALAPIKAQFEAKAAPLNSEVETLFQGLHAWAEANRAAELKGESKTIRMGAGELSWRLTPWAVTVRKADDILKLLRSSRKAVWKTFIREKFELNKEAMLESAESRAEAEKIPGIAITRKEEFAAKPFASEIEKVEAKAVSLLEAAA
jgi:phage host-nuclease inhibitor protein Gam